MKPKRVQLKRTKGWKMPPNTVSVTRPGKWGNQFYAGMHLCDIPFIVISHLDVDAISSPDGTLTHDGAVLAHAAWLELSYTGKCFAELARQKLRGKNLACWCELGVKCHADNWLRVANE